MTHLRSKFSYYRSACNYRLTPGTSPHEKDVDCTVCLQLIAEQKDVAFLDGHSSYRIGVGKYDNPHTQNAVAHMKIAWAEGWGKAQIEESNRKLKEIPQ